ncbi:MAG TPA: hypothetical protein VFV19_07120 [Candidatus Polarisedimenticolaceae bacterium]|nr:hypothetical protein [Candidatus Polarisedimenticolaceae bacterium]
MKPEEIDRILAEKDDLVPSSGFTDAVMDAVRREAATPPPIPFPWKRAWPVVVAGAAALALVPAVVVIEAAAPSPLRVPPELGWIALAAAVTLVSIGFSWRAAKLRG